MVPSSSTNDAEASEITMLPTNNTYNYTGLFVHADSVPKQTQPLCDVTSYNMLQMEHSPGDNMNAVHRIKFFY